MPVRSLGHAVLNVRDLDQSVAFYRDVLGLPVATRSDKFGMVFFSLGNHHDFAIRAVGEDAPAPNRKGVGLFHVAFCVGSSLDDLREMKERLDAGGVKIDGLVDHNVTSSIYVRDPDGNGIELYADTSDAWRDDPSKIAAAKPLML